MFRSIRMLCAMTLCAIVSLVQVSKAEETLVIAADEWCPYNCNPASELPGYMVEIAKEAFEPKGYKIVYKTMPWEKAVEDARKGYVHAIIAAAEQEAPDFVLPNEAQGFSESFFFVRTNSNWYYEGVESLNQIRLAVIEGYDYGEEIGDYIVTHKDNSSKIHFHASDENEALHDPIPELIEELISRKVGAYPEDRYVMAYNLKKLNKVGSIKKAGEFSEPEYLYLAFSPNRKNSQALADILTNSMRELRKSGKLREILAKYGLEDWQKNPIQ